MITEPERKRVCQRMGEEEVTVDKKADEEIEQKYVEMWPEGVRKEVLLTLNAMRERLSKHNADRVTVQESIRKACSSAREELDALELRILKEFETHFIAEDDRIQKAMWELRKRAEEDTLGTELETPLRKAKAELLSEQKYHVTVNEVDIANMIQFTTSNNLAGYTPRPPTDLKVRATSSGYIDIEFNHLNSYEQKVLAGNNINDRIAYVASLENEGGKITCEYPIRSAESPGFQLDCPVTTGKPYKVRVKALYKQGGSDDDEDDAKFSEWSGPGLFVPSFVECCAWVKPQENIAVERIYRLINPNTVQKLGENCFPTTVVGTATLPPSKNSTWDITVQKARQNKGKGVYVGVAPYDIDPNMPNQKKCGWYMYCFDQSLFSGPPFSYKSKRFDGSTGSYFPGEVRVSFNAAKRPVSLAFKLKSSPCFHVAYKNIPMDKPLVPAVVIENIDTVVSISALENEIILD